MEKFAHSNSRAKGTYKEFNIPGQRLCANVTCPVCGNTFSLSNHTITSNGNVSPSVICPQPGCTFQEYIHLDGWYRFNHDFLTKHYEEVKNA